MRKKNIKKCWKRLLPCQPYKKAAQQRSKSLNNAAKNYKKFLSSKKLPKRKNSNLWLKNWQQLCFNYQTWVINEGNMNTLVDSYFHGACLVNVARLLGRFLVSWNCRCRRLPNISASNSCKKVGHWRTAKMDRAISMDFAEQKTTRNWSLVVHEYVAFLLVEPKSIW